jgi:CheY-like chemotaxis protein
MSSKKVLLVDDDAVFVMSVAAVLGTRYEVVTASNGTEGRAKARSEKPDLVILDVMMDHLSEGFDVAKELRQDDSLAAMKIMMLTAVDEVYNVRMEVGENYVRADRFVEKPVTPEQILTHVEELIGL